MKNKTKDKKEEIKTVNPTPLTARAREVNEVGRTVYDVFDEGLRFIIKRGPFHWCGYVGIPKDHPLAGFGYDDISFVSAHGGLTFAREGGNNWPENYYWYGWDYGHSGDYSHFEHRPDPKERGDKDWMIEEVIKDSWDTLYEFKQLMKFAEKINKNVQTKKD